MSVESNQAFTLVLVLLWFEIGRVLVSNTKHLMTGPRGNSEFCSPETLNVSRGKAEGNIEVVGKQNSLFPVGPVIKCFVIPPNWAWGLGDVMESSETDCTKPGPMESCSGGPMLWTERRGLNYTSQLKTWKICEEIVCLTPAGSQMCRGFKEHDLITCESKVEVVVSPESYWVEWVLTHDTWRVLLQLKNVLELGGITVLIGKKGR